MKTVTIGAIVPVYNVEKYLRECIESLVQQTVQFDEIILVNDGSTDSSKDICGEYVCQYSNIKLINQHNQGLSAARNKGMSVTKSDYVIFVDSDDYLTLDTVEGIKRVLAQQQDFDIVYYSASIKNETGAVVSRNQYKRRIDVCDCPMAGLDFFERTFYNNHIVSACMAAYNKSFLRENSFEFPQGLYFEDNLFTMQTMCSASEVFAMQDQFYVRRYREDSILTGKWGEKKYQDFITVYGMCCKYIIDIFKEKSIREKFRSYFSHVLIRIMEKIDIANEYKFDEEEKAFLKTFFSLGWEVQESYRLCEIGALLLALKRQEKYPELLTTQGKDAVVPQGDYDDLKVLFNNKMKKWLEILPLNEDGCRIGIYGMGEHTKNLFKFYGEYVGEIKADIFFVVSEVRENKIHDGKMVIACDDLDDKEAVYIISSRIYQDEMEKKLLSVGVHEEKIIKMYNYTDFGELVMCGTIIELLAK